MAERQVQTKMKLELKRLVLSSIAIFEEVQGQSPTTWDQFSEMMRTKGESSVLDEREHSLDMSWRSSLDALGINTNYSLEVKPGTLTLRWIDDATEQEVVATPRMQA